MRCQVAAALSNLGSSERVACRVAGVSRSGFYEHKFHVPSDRYIRRLILMGLVADRFNVALSPSADYREGRLAKRGALPQKDPT
jgi:hypothetical protein